jgi:CRP-like cAMP-binding protein
LDNVFRIYVAKLDEGK